MHRFDHILAILGLCLSSQLTLLTCPTPARAGEEGGARDLHFDAVPARELMALVDDPTVMGWWEQFTRGKGSLKSIQRVQELDGRRVAYTFLMYRDSVSGTLVPKEFTVILARRPDGEDFAIVSIQAGWGGNPRPDPVGGR